MIHSSFLPKPAEAARPGRFLFCCVAALSWVAAMASGMETHPPGGEAARSASAGGGATGPATPFVHPGILHTAADLGRIKARLAAGEQPWRDGFEKLRSHPQSTADWRLRGPFADVVRGPGESRHIAELEADANAAYQNALLWCLTGEAAHAAKAIGILNAWAPTLRSITGHDKQLAASLCGFKLVNAAELLRHTGAGWRTEEIERFKRMIQTIVCPVIKDFATFANGNWDTGCIKTMMAMGVFLDDRAMFDRAVDYFHRGTGNGALTHYVINATGQCQESGRDQQHTQLGLAHPPEACEIAWHQALEPYGPAGTRPLQWFENTAKYNLGQDVPFTPHTDLTGKNKAKVISPEGRGRLRSIYEMVWNHYERRRGVPAPFTRRAAEKIRPEGAGFGADHPGFGTLLFSLPEKAGG